MDKQKDNNQAIRPILETLRQSVDELSLTPEIIGLLLPNGVPHEFESDLWDYKEKLPALPQSPTEADRKLHKAELGDIIKDAVAFYNAFGGYIVFGVTDKGKNRVPGTNTHFDCGDFNKRIFGYTETNIQCLYKIFNFPDAISTKTIGLLLIPRRPAGISPVKFKKDGPEKPSGGRSFVKETYVRVRDECRPATASSEDWKFLHSERLPPGAHSSSRPHNVKTNLPARDPDLIEFLGREKPLTELRTWISDLKAPVRLITGIGGLGKTTLAYRFAEEVVETKVPSVEWVVWVTAKERTYSALKDQIVATGKVDFTDIVTLYQVILKVLAHEFPMGEDEPDVDDLMDRVVEALSHLSCLIVVDDVDSLQPDQQRAVVSALNGIALRTVGRDIPPSRILITSRIDQGLPDTAVTKITGLEEKAFDQHVINLCNTFKIPLIHGYILEDLFKATSGSPLFAASIVRLVKTGENLKEVVETWKGQEGEDVRRFAFEREVKRLNSPQAKLLYAVLLLGETSVADLAAVLEATPRVIRTRVSELQAYHLLATDVKTTGDTTIFPPSDLVAISEIVRKHLGLQAETVEQACARAEEQSRATAKSVGLGIRNVLRLWEQDRASEALVVARDLRVKNPNNGDVASLFGAALLRLSPPRYGDADEALEAARRLGCVRPELLSNIVRTKIGLEDWIGLYSVTKGMYSAEYSKDVGLDAYLLASRNLINIARDRRDDKRIIELSIAAVEQITLKLNRQRVEPTYFARLTNGRFDFSREYVKSLEAYHSRKGDKLMVFEGVVRLADSGVVLIDLVRSGLHALANWWKDVEERPFIDHTAIDILGRQIKRLDRLAVKAEEIQSDGVLAGQISATSRELAYKGAKLVS